MKPAAISISFIFALLFFGVSAVHAQERTLEEFKEYVAEKTGGQLDDQQLDEISGLVDKDNDGSISEEEFENRMAAFRQIMSGNRQSPRPSNSDNDKTKDSPPQKKTEDVKEVVEIPAFTNSKNATVLLITADELAKSWVPFASWKTSYGKLTKIVTIGQIARDFDGDSIQEKIRKCVRTHIDQHETQWVILGGDSLPGGKGLVPGGHTTVHNAEPRGIPTDIVYLSPTNWDADGDGIYGEFDDDREAITYPDGSVGLGRIPVRTEKDVVAFTDKVIAYESRYPTTDFARQMIYTCTDSPAYPKVRNSWDSYVSSVWDGEVGRFFSQETPWDEEDKPGSYPLSADNLVKLLNEKSTSKLHIHGHGHLPAWVLEKSQFTKKHVSLLKNDGAYPLITTVSCNTGEYDSKKDPSIVERILRLPKAGSVAVVAPIRTGKPHFASRSDFRLMVEEGKLDGTTLTMTRYWTFGLGEGATTGHAIMKAKNAMAKDAQDTASYHLCICELNLLGDPTLDMRAEKPRNPNATYAEKNTAKERQLNVTTDAPNATVCAMTASGEYQVTKTDSDGNATLKLKPGKDHLMVMVSGRNLNSKKVNQER